MSLINCILQWKKNGFFALTLERDNFLLLSLTVGSKNILMFQSCTSSLPGSYCQRVKNDIRNSSHTIVKERKKVTTRKNRSYHRFLQKWWENQTNAGKNDYVSIKKNQHEQKRLVLCNLYELYVTFKEQNPNVKIRFSKFYSLRPKLCVNAGKFGTHSVCMYNTSKCCISCACNRLGCDIQRSYP